MIVALFSFLVFLFFSHFFYFPPSSPLAGAGDCLPCIPGKNQGSSKAASCTNCPQHTFNKISAQIRILIACESCVAGQFTDAPGRTSCQVCQICLYIECIFLMHSLFFSHSFFLLFFSPLSVVHLGSIQHRKRL